MILNGTEVDFVIQLTQKNFIDPPLSTYVDLANAKRAAQPLPALPHPARRVTGEVKQAWLFSLPVLLLHYVL